MLTPTEKSPLLDGPKEVGFFLFFAFPSYISGVHPLLGEIFAYVTVFSSNHKGSHIPSSWMVRAGCVFVAGIHPSRTWTSGSFESVRWNACVHRLTRPRFILSSERVLGGMEFEPMLTPREKSPLRKMSPEEDRTRDAVNSEPKHYQLSYSGPPKEVWTHKTLHKIASPTHKQLSCSSPW